MPLAVRLSNSANFAAASGLVSAFAKKGAVISCPIKRAVTYRIWLTFAGDRSPARKWHSVLNVSNAAVSTRARTNSHDRARCAAPRAPADSALSLAREHHELPAAHCIRLVARSYADRRHHPRPKRSDCGRSACYLAAFAADIGVGA